MPFKLEFTETFADDIARLPVALQNFVENELDRLAADPLRHAIRGAPPAAPNSLYLRFENPNFDGERWIFRAGFVFGVDEETLVITFLAVQRADVESE